ncbi:hypothetical protein [Phyllobacterium endophyticum]|uniref:hypothetical protein n=1 Tax=Phyllobacterium endophyticum TaxID=1149773 RepID=UPI0011C8AB53|nr:hypothetical protein [Phyllobacterium endophyticum]TXR46972.1 hypothetical protein FVA77_22470 [Phyllobacterium endophyticum]
MVFKSIFDLANNASNVTASAETEIFSYIQKQPNEAISIPPHDAKIKPGVPVPQDPKIVRETAPQAQSVFNLISTLTGAIGQSATQHATAFNDPNSVVDSGASIMKAAQETTNKVKDNIPSPSKGA